MSTSAAPSQSENFTRRVAWVAHNEAVLLVISAVLLVGPEYWSVSIAQMLFTDAGIVVFAVTFAASVHHAQRFLCPRCAASTPLDGEGAAATHATALRRFHYLVDHYRAAMWATGSLVVTAAVLSDTVGPLLDWIPQTLLFTFLTVRSVLMLRHRPLQPWCPQCRWDDGGRDEDAPIWPQPLEDTEPDHDPGLAVRAS